MFTFSCKVYDSLKNTAVADHSFRRGFATAYAQLANEEGNVHGRTIVTQEQEDTQDCGLFAIANAVGLAAGVDLTKVGSYNVCQILYKNINLREGHTGHTFDYDSCFVFMPVL